MTLELAGCVRASRNRPVALGLGFAVSMLILGACTPEYHNPYRNPPWVLGRVRLDATLTDGVGVPTGTRVSSTDDSVRVWLVDGERVVDSTLTTSGVYQFTLARGHSYRVIAGIPGVFGDTSAAIEATRDIAYQPDTLRLGRVGDLAGSPNPFTGQVVLEFPLLAAAGVDLSVYDRSGRRRRALASGNFAAGYHRVTWDGRDDGGAVVADGLYWAVLRSATEARAELLVKSPAVAVAGAR